MVSPFFFFFFFFFPNQNPEQNESYAVEDPVGWNDPQTKSHSDSQTTLAGMGEEVAAVIRKRRRMMPAEEDS